MSRPGETRWGTEASPSATPARPGFTTRPSFRWSDVWRAPLHDFPIRDEILYQYLPLAPGLDMLEVGPGSGFTAFRLARTIQHLTLVEVAPEAVSALSEALRDLPNVQLVRADVTSPDFSELLGQGFDAVYGLDVFEYVLDPAACLANLAAVLRAGGEMLLTYPNVPPPIGDGVTWFTQPGDLDRLLRQAGFRRWQVLTVRLRPAAGWLYSALHEWPLRLYRHLRGSSPDDRPQTYDRTWAFRHRQHLLRYRLPLHVVWAMLGGMIRLGGDVFEAEPATNDILGRQLMIRAWR